MNEIVQELDASADCYEANLIDDTRWLGNGWTEIVKDKI